MDCGGIGAYEPSEYKNLMKKPEGHYECVVCYSAFDVTRFVHPAIPPSLGPLAEDMCLDSAMLLFLMKSIAIEIVPRLCQQQNIF